MWAALRVFIIFYCNHRSLGTHNCQQQDSIAPCSVSQHNTAQPIALAIAVALERKVSYVFHPTRMLVNQLPYYAPHAEVCVLGRICSLMLNGREATFCKDLNAKECNMILDIFQSQMLKAQLLSMFF